MKPDRGAPPPGIVTPFTSPFLFSFSAVQWVSWSKNIPSPFFFNFSKTAFLLTWSLKVAEDDIAFKLAILKKSLHLNDNTCFCSIIQSSKLFLAATKQLYEWFSPSVRLSICLSHLFDYVPIIVSSWNFQELLPVKKVTSMQKVKVRGQRSRSQRSQPNLTVSGL